MTHLRLIFALACLLCTVCAQDQSGDPNGAEKMKCYDDRGEPIRCVPEFVNAAFRRTVISNNTCGTPPSKYCVQTLSTGQREECQICDNSSKTKSHTSLYITDIKDDKNYSWWQSDTMHTFIQNGKYDRRNRVSKVVLTLDLGKTFEIVSIRLRFRSLRPESMAIFKQTTSDKSDEWIPYQYYSRSCEEFYDIEPDGLIVGRDDLQTALCTAKYSQLVPLFGGEVLFRTLANRPGRNEIERLPQLQEWIRAYSLKFELDRLNTFGDDIFGDPNVLRSYYYAIIDLTVVGKCHCNGHASICEENNSTGGNYVCKCEHNTAGVDCERCKPTHNNKPWGMATSANAHACEACECNGLAETCEFDERLYQTTGKGGRCIDCQNNTGGPHCERCRDNYHRETEDRECKACNCNPIGSQSLQCYRDGRCYCKPGVTGDKCDRCRPNYYGFSEDGCSPCECSVLGTRPDNFQCDENGQCACKKNVVGKNCDRCLDGHFALEADNPYGCRQCFCYGHSSDCKSAGGYSSINLTSVFRFGSDSWRAVNGKGEDVTRDLATWNPSEQSLGVTSINQDSLYLTAPASYLDMKRSSYSRILSFRFKVADTSNMQFTQSDIMLISRKNGLNISTSLTGQGNPVPTRQFQLYQYRLHEDPSFDWMPQLKAFEFQRLLNHLDEIKIKMTYSDQGTGIIDDISLEYAIKDENSVDFVNWVEECTCPPPYVGLSCGACREGHKHETVNGSSYDRCVRCECNNHADQCDPDTGRCLCLDNTAGDDCSRCKEGFYGNPTAGTKDDCKPCPCVFGSKCILIGSKVKCTDCPVGHQGDLCDSCIDGFYGDPAGLRGPKTACKKCNCNGNIDTNAVQNCDSETGDCLKCIHNTRNGPDNQCELCKVGYYGDATSYPKPGCKPCDCHENGTYTLVPTTSPLPCDERGKCVCRPNVVGLKCDQCRENFWNINSRDGCIACECHSFGAYNDSCDFTTGQCVCKPGVGGRQCDECLPDHYQFSPEGCKACNCNSDGSLGVACDENGRCVCRPGVLGVKCDQCGENRFNLSAGCTRCPPCYDELQIKVNKLRDILEALNKSGVANGTSGNADAKPDEAFLKKLNSVKRQLYILLWRAENISVNDKELMRRLDAVNQTLSLIEAKLKESEAKTSDADKISKNALKEIDLADASIERSWEIVEQISSSASQAKLIIEQITEIMNNWTKTTDRISEIIREVQNLSAAQWDEVQELKRKANQALNNSKSASNGMDDAIAQQGETLQEITIIDNKANDMATLADKTLANASVAYNLASSTLSAAENLLIDAATPLDDVNVDETRERAADTTTEAKAVQEEAKRLAEEAKKGQKKIDKGEVKTRIKKLYDHENATNDLLRQAKEANKTAHYAIVNGTRTLELAKNDLRLLENFTKIINESKAKAEKANENIPEIQRLIDSANNNTAEANEEIGDAQRNVKDANDIADRAMRTSSDTEQDAEDLENRVNNLVVPDDKVYDDVKEAEKKFKNYEDQAEKNAHVVKNATKMANESKMTAKSVVDIITQVGYQIRDLDSMIADIDDLDNKTLTEFERKIKVQEEMESTFDASIKVLEERKRLIDQQIQSYYIDLSELEEALVEITKNHEKLPKICLKTKPPPS